MRRRTNERLLNWGFVLSLSLHAAALTGAALLPTVVVQGDLAEIRVFDAAAPPVLTPVELVTLSAAQLPTEAATVEAVETAPEPVASEPAPPTRTARPAPQPQPVRAAPAPKRAEPVVSRPRPKVKPAPEPTAPVAAPAPVTPGTAIPQVDPASPQGPTGGGGGGPVDLGAPSTGGDLPATPGGGTPTGTLPGSGAGAGSGSGSGTGGGAGTGDGGGVGAGSGDGDGAGSGSGFPSRVADRSVPVVTHKGSLEYPPAAAAEGVEGTVRLRVLVTEAGKVADVRVVQSSRDRRLDTAAVAFVKGWEYQPAVQNGQPRSVYTHALVTFKLK